MTAVDGLRRVGAGEVRELSALLARAFFEDEVARYLFPSADRLSRLQAFFATQLRHVYLPRGEVYTTEDLSGVAMWIVPEMRSPRARDGLAFLNVVMILGPGFLRARRLGRFLAGQHPPMPHYYLGTLGVEPARQGLGIGSALLEPMIKRSDETGNPIYLECSTKAARRFYERHGFSIRAQVKTPRCGPRLWLMWRVPR
jgi:ribosomal protein S18 acetylase RimI-like enzyme